MRHGLFALVAACALSACATLPVASPRLTATVAQGVGTADATYVAATKFGAALVSLGQLDKARYQRLDNEAYAALLVVRYAARTGTAPDLITATRNFSATIAAIYALKGN